eukprot:tig00020704_g13188.t1
MADEPPRARPPAAPLFPAFAGAAQQAQPPAPAGGLFAAYATPTTSTTAAPTGAGWLRASSYVPPPEQPSSSERASRYVVEDAELPAPAPLSALAVVGGGGKILEGLDEDDPVVQLAKIRARKALALERQQPQRRAPEEYALVDSEGEEVDDMTGPAGDSLPVLAEDQRGWERALVEERVRRDREKARQRRKERKREKKRRKKEKERSDTGSAAGTDREEGAGGTDREQGAAGDEEKRKKDKEKKKRKKKKSRKSSSSSSSSSSEGEKGKARPKRELALAMRPAEPPPAEGKFTLEAKPDPNNLAYESLYRLDVPGYKVQRGYQLFQKKGGPEELAGGEAAERRRVWSRRRGGFEDVIEVERGGGGGGTRYFEQSVQDKAERGKDRVVDMSRQALIAKGLGPALAGTKTRRKIQEFIPLEVIAELDTVGSKWDKKKEEAKAMREKEQERQRAMEAKKGAAELQEEAERLAVFEVRRPRPRVAAWVGGVSRA